MIKHPTDEVRLFEWYVIILLVSLPAMVFAIIGITFDRETFEPYARVAAIGGILLSALGFYVNYNYRKKLPKPHGNSKENSEALKASKSLEMACGMTCLSGLGLLILAI